MDLANQALELWWTEHPSFSAIASDPAGDLSEPRVYGVVNSLLVGEYRS